MREEVEAQRALKGEPGVTCAGESDSSLRIASRKYHGGEKLRREISMCWRTGSLVRPTTTVALCISRQEQRIVTSLQIDTT